MEPITIVIIEDSADFADGLKKVLETQTVFPCKVHILNPDDGNRPKAPTFDEFVDEIERYANDETWPYYLILMDNHLGRWRWKGANIAPSFHNVMAISTDEDTSRWADCAFEDKASIAYHDRADSKQRFLATVVSFLKKKLPPMQGDRRQNPIAPKGGNMLAKEMDPLLELLRKRMPKNAEVREKLEKLMSDCAEGLSWSEISNPDFELPLQNLTAFAHLKAYAIEQGIIRTEEVL